LHFVITGQVVINPDIPASQLDAGLGSLVVCGQILCPEHLTGIVQAKTRQLHGQILSYTEGARLVFGSLNLTEGYLRGLTDGSELHVFGSLTAIQPLPHELVTQKVRTLHVYGKIICRESLAPELLTRLSERTGAPAITFIPTGFEYVDNQLVLDMGMLSTLSDTKLYCTQRVQIAQDVTPEAMEQALESLIVEDWLICPAALRSTIARKCNLLETQVIFYSGELWLVDHEATLATVHFDYWTGKVTIVVFGALHIAPEVAPGLLASRLDKFHNLGEVYCNAEQQTALEVRLGSSEGEFVDPATVEAVDDTEVLIGNAAYLKL
jgi:hypothetical protein